MTPKDHLQVKNTLTYDMEKNKQQTAVEQLINHLMEYGFDLSLHKIEIEHFKEMQKDQHIKSWEAGLMKVDFNEYYEQTYGGNK
jgi:hypothetical protein